MSRPAFFSPGLFTVALLLLGAAAVEIFMPRHCVPAPVPVASDGQAKTCTDRFEMADRSFREP